MHRAIFWCGLAMAGAISSPSQASVILTWAGSSTSVVQLLPSEEPSYILVPELPEAPPPPVPEPVVPFTLSTDVYTSPWLERLILSLSELPLSYVLPISDFEARGEEIPEPSLALLLAGAGAAMLLVRTRPRASATSANR